MSKSNTQIEMSKTLVIELAQSLIDDIEETREEKK